MPRPSILRPALLRPSTRTLIALHGVAVVLLVLSLFAGGRRRRGLRRLAWLTTLPHLWMAWGCLRPRSTIPGPVLRRLPVSAHGGRRVALTFDDGPDPEVTPRVLDLLDRYGAKASFFVVGERAAAHPDLVAEIVRRGHRVENHTHRHSPAFALLGPRAAGREIDRTQEVVEALTGRRPDHFRPVAGMRNPWLAAVLAERSLTLAAWTRRGFDTVDPDPARVARRLLRHLTPGDVLLFHDGSAARDGDGRAVVLEVLERVLEEMAGRGWVGCALSTAAPTPGLVSVTACSGGPDGAFVRSG